MKLLYLKKFQDEEIEIDNSNCKRYLRCSTQDLLILLGINPVKIVQYRCIVSGKYPNINVFIEGIDLRMIATLYLDNKSIFINSLEVTTKGIGIGYFLFNSQIKQALSAGFDTIECLANGCYEKINFQNGYVTCGKFGFIMNYKSQIEFDNLLAINKRSEANLFDLLNAFVDEKPEGEKFWIKKGKRWYGIFNLTNMSKSRRNFQYYKMKRLLQRN